jgi:DNA invertase Pin-like site-specific DNA recombinase
MEAVSALKRGDVLIVAKRDRLGRDVIEVALIERLVSKRGARVVSAAGEGTESDDPSGLLMRRLIDSFAEYERLIIGARTKSALAAKRRRVERTSRFAPYGFQIARDGRRLDVNHDEQRVLDNSQPATVS